jgi:tetratricopeptide (TPR) repeat protein
MEVFNVEKEKIEKLLLSDENLKKEWKKIQTEKAQITFELENVRKKQQVSQDLLEAQELFDKKDYDGSLKIINQLLELDSRNEAALMLSRKISEATSSTAAKEKYLKALEFYEQGRFTDAIFKADEAVRIEPNYAEAQVLVRQSKAQNYILQKRYQDAKYELVEAIKIKPDDKNILELLKRVQTTIDVMEVK